MAKKFSLKDHLFNEVKVTQLSNEISVVYPEFDGQAFIQHNISKFPDLELKERIICISEGLKKFLPENYRSGTDIILKALPDPLDENGNDNDFGDFIYAPYSEYVANYGCNYQDLDFSLNAIKEITKRFSAEYAIRKFINNFPEETLETISKWTSDQNYHVRRLCSEGTRPKLPWGQKISINPTQSLSILEKLYYDPTRFVTRSVANHLNDYTKINPEVIIQTIKKWVKSQKQEEKEMQFITKHALRNLVKDGNQVALEILSFSNGEGISISQLTFPASVMVGQTFNFSFFIHSVEDKRVVVDYTVYFQNKMGEMYNKKVYKLVIIDIEAEKNISVSKNHPFRANMTTRTLYPGIHRIDIQVNGEVKAKFEFELIRPD